MSFFQNTSAQGKQWSMDQKQEPQLLDAHDIEVSQLACQDSISCIKFAPCLNNPVYQNFGPKMVAVADWSGMISVLQVNVQPSQQGNTPAVNPVSQQQNGSPVLGLCWQEDQPALLIASSDNNIKKWDLQSNQIVTIGQHNQPVKDVISFLHPQTKNSVVISAGWDCLVKFWTWSAPNQLNQFGEAYVGSPVHYMSCSYPLLVTAHSEKIVHYWNLNQTLQTQNFNPTDVIESPLKFATTSICAFGDGKGFAIGSIEGRCGIVNLDFTKDDLGKGTDFCFKCHREEHKIKKGEAEVFQINGIAFNKAFNTFTTFGSDGVYYLWNKDTKSKLKNSGKFPAPVTAADLSEDGQLYGFAIGYDWSKGAEGLNQQQYMTKFYIRAPLQDEIFKQPGAK